MKIKEGQISVFSGFCSQIIRDFRVFMVIPSHFRVFQGPRDIVTISNEANNCQKYQQEPKLSLYDEECWNKLGNLKETSVKKNIDHEKKIRIF